MLIYNVLEQRWAMAEGINRGKTGEWFTLLRRKQLFDARGGRAVKRM
jgi:hypothetical protein